jgi:chloramphenicol-sensitive protein RarD
MHFTFFVSWIPSIIEFAIIHFFDILAKPVEYKIQYITMKKGIIQGIIAYTLWGIFPIYWKTLQNIPSLEILCHRMIWSFMFLLALLTLKKQWAWIVAVKEIRIVRITYCTTAAFLSINWLTYIWAVNAGYIVDASLGYFINPLISVLLGVIFLQEKLRTFQWIAAGIAGCGVLYLTVGYGSFPWIGLTLAFTFGFYGLLRKTAHLNAVEGLSLETAVLFIPALGYLVYLELQGNAAFFHAGPGISGLLCLAGIVTAVPLMFFASSARKINLSTVGLLQYIAPTFQFSIGILVYSEPFSKTRLTGFLIIWTALAIYAIEGYIFNRNRDAKKR